MSATPACREGHREIPCTFCWAADSADRCTAGRLAYGDGLATTVLAHLRATTAADQAKWLAEALRRHP